MAPSEKAKPEWLIVGTKWVVSFKHRFNNIDLEVLATLRVMELSDNGDFVRIELDNCSPERMRHSGWYLVKNVESKFRFKDTVGESNKPANILRKSYPWLKEGNVLSVMFNRYGQQWIRRLKIHGVYQLNKVNIGETNVIVELMNNQADGVTGYLLPSYVGVTIDELLSQFYIAEHEESKVD